MSDNSSYELILETIAQRLEDIEMQIPEVYSPDEFLPIISQVMRDLGNVKFDLSAIEPDIRQSFMNALKDLNLQASVSLNAIDVNLSSINVQIQEAIVSALRDAHIEIPMTVSSEQLQNALESVLVNINRRLVRRWNHSIYISDAPPNEDTLDKAGANGYELINVVYNERQHKWHSYFKKLVESYT